MLQNISLPAGLFRFDTVDKTCESNWKYWQKDKKKLFRPLKVLL